MPTRKGNQWSDSSGPRCAQWGRNRRRYISLRGYLQQSSRNCVHKVTRVSNVVLGQNRLLFPLFEASAKEWTRKKLNRR
jgi:hypothetical protein